jgi:hypothetical protein
MGAPPASVCEEDATWRGRCPAHGGTHPSTPELMILLGQLTGWGDQSLSVDIGFKRRHDVWGFTARVKIIGLDLAVDTQGETLEFALRALCEAVATKVSDIGRQRAEDAEKAQDVLAKFIMYRTSPVNSFAQHRGP